MVQIKFKICIKFSLITFLPFLLGFTVLSGPEEARLDVSPTSPTVEFVLDDETPTISAKEEFLNGKYAGESDAAFWSALLQEAMMRWNEVEASYIQLIVSTATTPNLDREDRVNSIIVGDINLSAAAFSAPNVEGDSIIDCDIKVSKRSTSARSLAYTLMHELGHCLGLGHSHTNYDAVMGYSRASRSLKLGADDIAGLVYLYPDPDHDADEPEEQMACGSLGNTNKNPTSHLFLVLLLLTPILFSLRRLNRFKQT